MDYKSGDILWVDLDLVGWGLHIYKVVVCGYDQTVNKERVCVYLYHASGIQVWVSVKNIVGRSLLLEPNRRIRRVKI